MTACVNVVYSFVNMIHDSPRQTPREARHDANEARILDAALGLVGAGGLEALSMARLADAVDFTPGALYRYYGSKDALLAAMVARILEGLREHLVSTVAALPPKSNALVRVFALARGFGAWAGANPHGFGLLAVTLAEPRVLLTDEADAQPVTARVLAALELVAEALVDAEEESLLDEGDVFERTVCLLAALHGLLQLRKRAGAAPRALDVEALAQAATRALLVGWGATSRSVTAALKKLTPLPGAPS